MKENKNKGIIIGVILVIIIAIVVAVIMLNRNNNAEEVNTNLEEESYTKQLEDGSKLNISEEFNETKMYNGLKITNIQFTEKNGMSVLLADVENTATTDHQVELVKITILGKNGEEIAQINSVIGDIAAGEQIKLNTSITADVTDAKDFKIEPKE